jgi:hypothetical protein
MSNAHPGQTNGTFAVTLTPTDYLDVFFPSGMSGEYYTLQQLMIASPVGYGFSEGVSCRLDHLSNSSQPTPEVTACEASEFFSENRTYLTVNITDTYSTSNDSFLVIFDGVKTPSGVNDTSLSTTVYSTDSNLSPVYFIFNDSEGTPFNTFLRVSDISAALLSSGSFLPENIYPGNSGSATLSFYTDAQIPAGGSIEMAFGSKWGFTEDAVWTWQVYPTSGFTESDDAQLVSTGASTTSSTGEVLQNFSSATFSQSDNEWKLTVGEAISVGWVRLNVDRVKNPSVAYSGLNFATIQIRDSLDQLITSGQISAISVELVSTASSSPYNYVTLVVLIGSLFFCCMVIRSNGLSFSLGSIWTDITAMCTVLALATSIVNNFLWLFTQGSAYFYISRLFLCFTFTMLTAVCFHWGTVLSLRLRKLPKTTASVAFVVMNTLFYVFQASFLFYHRNLISKVYATQSDVTSLAYQQCDDSDSSGNVFSEIQGYLWVCYAGDTDKFFLVSTTVTYGLFLVVTVAVMALGVMVMRRGRLLLGNASGPHQVALIKALRLYYALIGIVTLVYVLSWIVQIASRSTHAIAYPWFYVFTVWLPSSIPPCCLIFLQWNSTAKSLRDADSSNGEDNSPLSQSGYGEIRTPSFAFSMSDRWTLTDDGTLVYDTKRKNDVGDDSDEFNTGTSAALLTGHSASGGTGDSSSDDYIGLSMALETNEEFRYGCFVAIQRSAIDPITKTNTWKQVSNTDTVLATPKEALSSRSIASPSGRFVYTFLSVPQIPVVASGEKIRLVAYALSDAPMSVSPEDHSELTAAAVLAALERDSSQSDDQDDSGMGSLRTLDSSMVDVDASEFHTSPRVIDELFEMESEGDDASQTSGSGRHHRRNHTLSVVAEFTVSTSVLVTSVARTEQAVLTATENSFKQYGPQSLPPKLMVHTVISNAAGGKYGEGAGLLATTHSISKQYHIRERGLLVVEDLTESRFSNWIPRQVLEIIIRHRTKELLIAENDLARLEAYDRQRQKGSDRGIYENLIQQIQDDGDLNRCREWMLQRCHTRKDYVDLLRKLRRVYVSRDQHKNYFKASTEKKSSPLRFLPINLHLQEMWVGSAHTQLLNDGRNASPDSASAANKANELLAPAVYDIVTVGAMAAHVYKFKNGGILGLEQQHDKMKARTRETPGSVAAHHQNPLWTEEEQKTDDFEWDLIKRMDVCFPQAVAALVTAFTRKVDLALQHVQPAQGQRMLEHLEKLGFLFDVESLVSTHGNEAGMLEDMAGAVNELRHVRFVLVDETADDDGEEDNDSDARAQDTRVSLSFHMEEESKTNTGNGTIIEQNEHLVDEEVYGNSSNATSSAGVGGSTRRKHGRFAQRLSSERSATSSSSNSTIAGVIDVDVFTNIDDALSETSSAKPPPTGPSAGTLAAAATSFMAGRASSADEIQSRSNSSSFSGVGQRLLSSLMRARTHRFLGGNSNGANFTVQSLAPTSADKLFPFTHLVIRVKVRTSKVKLPPALLRHGTSVRVCPVLFTQGINEKQTLANNTGSSVTRLQDAINEVALKNLRSYCDRYCNYTAYIEQQQPQVQAQHEQVSACGITASASREEVLRMLSELEALLASSRQARKKRPEILQISSDLCRRVGGGRVTVCKSAKDRTGMSVTLEQGRILVQQHGLRESKKAGIVAVMRSEGVRIENALKNTGRRVFAFNALQRSLLPEEYRCPPQTAGRNVS